MQIKTRMRNLLKWPKFGSVTTLNADENAEQQEFSYVTSGKAKWYGQFARVFGGILQD